MDYDEDDATGTHQTGDDEEPSLTEVDPKSQGEDQTISSAGDPSTRFDGHTHPETVAHYRIIGKLGQGGMGVVWEAEQESPKRRVALKVMRRDHVVDELHRRMFHREAETLARLKHPNIAAIYESGHTDEGQDFFAMELVQGQTLGRWLAGRPDRIDPDELELRLHLFRTICDAVHYAHQRGVIHRDLKPSNLIVTDETGSGGGSGSGAGLPTVKILDFGLARITDADLNATMVSEVGMIKGTLQYMSPEQARGDIEAIDVRTDVYALGMILYEMLTGQRPYEVRRAALAEAVRVICEESPAPLTQTWSGVRRVDGDLATIVGKALEKEIERRYGSAAALSEDVDRYMESQPIQARPPSATYQLRKMVQRNRLAAAFAATVLLMIVAFGIWMSVLYRRLDLNYARALTAEASASREAETSREVSDFLVGLFEVSDPGSSLGQTITAREVLDRGADRIDRELAHQPAVQARLQATMGEVYQNLGLFDQAGVQFEASLQSRQLEFGPDHPDVLDSRSLLAWLRILEARHEEAQLMLEEVVEQARIDPGPDDPRTAEWISKLAVVHSRQGRFDVAEPLLTEALEIQRRLLGSDDPRTIATLSSLATMCGRQRRLDDAEVLFLEALDACRRVHGELHPKTLWTTANLGNVYLFQKRLDEAETFYTLVLEGRREVLGPHHPDTISAIANMAYLMQVRGDWDRAEIYGREAIDLRSQALGATHPHTLNAMNNLAFALAEAGRVDGAREIATELMDACREAARVPEAPTQTLSVCTTQFLNAEPADLRDPAAAMPLAVRMNEATDFKNPRYLATLALAHYRLGQVGRAIEVQNQAVTLLPEGESDLRTRLEVDLVKMENGSL